MKPLPRECGMKVTNQTQTSRNLVYEITQAMKGVKHCRTVTGGTRLHGQSASNLCWAFGINTGVRYGLMKLTGNKTGRQVKDGYGYKVVEGGRTAQQIFKDNSQWNSDYNVCSFQSMLSSLTAHVIPRSLEGLDGDPFRHSMIGKQATDLERAVEKLTRKTMFETEGWKRIPGCLRFMESFQLNPEHFELIAEKIIHPNSRGFSRFIAGLQNDRHCFPHPQLVNPRVDPNCRTFRVSQVEI